MGDPRPTCPECGAVINPRCFVTVSDYEAAFSSIDQVDTSLFNIDRFGGIYCSNACVVDAFQRGWPEHRGLMFGEVD